MFAFWYQEWHFDGYTTHEYELSDIGEVALGAAEPEFESFSAKANLISVPEGEALLLPIQGAEDHTPLALHVGPNGGRVSWVGFVSNHACIPALVNTLIRDGQTTRPSRGSAAAQAAEEAIEHLNTALAGNAAGPAGLVDTAVNDFRREGDDPQVVQMLEELTSMLFESDLTYEFPDFGSDWQYLTAAGFPRGLSEKDRRLQALMDRLSDAGQESDANGFEDAALTSDQFSPAEITELVNQTSDWIILALDDDPTSMSLNARAHLVKLHDATMWLSCAYF